MIHNAHFDDVGVCFDFGHAHMMGSVREAFEIRDPVLVTARLWAGFARLRREPRSEEILIRARFK